MQEQNTPPVEAPADKTPPEKKGHRSKTGMYILIAIVFVAILGLCGYVVWDRYQTTDSEDTEEDSDSSEESQGEDEEISETIHTETGEENTFNMAIGEKVTLETTEFTVNSVDEISEIPKVSAGGDAADTFVAAEGSTFVRAEITITNTDEQEDVFYSDYFLLVDNEGHEYTMYHRFFISDPAGPYLVYETLTPGIPKTGYVYFEVPADLTSYSLRATNTGANEVYLVKLK